jgi:drug/metabolite transporter (DMT)-like permease
MPLSALALVLVAALLHAGWNIVAKKSGGGVHFAMLSALAIVVIWSPLGLWLTWRDAPAYTPQAWALLAASGLVHVLYFSALLAGYRAADLTVVYPVARGSGPLLTAAVATTLLGETLGLRGIAGVVGVCGGVFLIAGGPALWAQAHDPARRARVQAGLRWGALTGALIAGYTVIDGYLVKRLGLSPILVDWLGNVMRVPLLLGPVLLDRAGFAQQCRQHWRAALVMGTVSPLAYVLVLYAAQQAPLSHVAPAREVSMLFAALLGGRLLGEGDRRLRLAGAVAIAGGVALLALG